MSQHVHVLNSFMGELHLLSIRLKQTVYHITEEMLNSKKELASLQVTVDNKGTDSDS